MSVRFNIGSTLQIQYRRDLNPMFEIVQGICTDYDSGWITLDSGVRYNRNRIKGLRNLSAEQAPPEMEPE